MLSNQYKTKKIFIAGHNGMVGRAIHNLLRENNFQHIFTANRQELDLTNYQLVSDFIRKNKIDVVVNAAAKVGGIMANSNLPYDFLMQNMQIQNNLIDAAVKNNISKFVFLGSSCVFPKFAKQPIKEDYLLTDFLEPTNQWYSIAKISGIYACIAAKKQTGLNTICLMPTNLYGPHDNFSFESSHVIPAMIRKFYSGKKNAEKVTLWGTGTPLREFLHVDDLASAVLFCLINNLKDDVVNVGYGKEISIFNLAQLIKSLINYDGDIIWDDSKPDGTPRKLLDGSILRNYGWKPKISLENGITQTIQWFGENVNFLND